MPLNSLDLTGTLTLGPGLAPGLPGRYVYQRTAPGKGNLPGTGNFSKQLRRHVIPYDPATTAQMARRALMAAAVARWHASTDQDKAAWKINAQNRFISVFNACISDTLRNFELIAGVLTKKTP